GEQPERQVELLGELLVRFLVVGRDTEDLDLALAELRVVVAEGAGLLRAAGRVVLRIKVEDDLAAAKVRERGALAILIDRLERGRRVALLEQFHRDPSSSGRVYVARARATAAFARSRVESSVGSGASSGRTMSGISVHASAAASQPSAASPRMTES